MSTFMLLNAFAIEGQYICTAALIMICSLAGVHIYLMSRRNFRKIDRQPQPLQETVSSDAEILAADADMADDEEGLVVLPLLGNRTVRGRYNKSFTAKLIQSSDEIKTYYADLANYLLGYGKVRNRISWANSSFRVGRKAVTKFAIRGKTLYLYFALDPAEFKNTKYSVTDESEVKRYETVPLRIKIKSTRGVKFARELIDILADRLGLIRSESSVGVVRVSDYPYDTTRNLLERGLIKLRIADGRSLADGERLIWEDFERRERVTVVEAQALISDEVAASLIDEKNDTVLPRPKGIINIDTLSQNYEANDTVTIESLKEKKLIGKSVNNVKVLARGILNKPLIVKMPEFSIDAVKMILLTGGKVVKLKVKGNK